MYGHASHGGNLNLPVNNNLPHTSNIALPDIRGSEDGICDFRKRVPGSRVSPSVHWGLQNLVRDRKRLEKRKGRV